MQFFTPNYEQQGYCLRKLRNPRLLAESTRRTSVGTKDQSLAIAGQAVRLAPGNSRSDPFDRGASRGCSPIIGCLRTLTFLPYEAHEHGLA